MLRRGLHEEGRQKGDEYVFHCPKCNHRKPKLSVNLVTDWFNCWICGKAFSGRTLVKLFAHLFGRDSQEVSQYLAHLEEQRGIIQEPPAHQFDEPTLPTGFRSLSVSSRSPYHRQAMEYLAGRGVSSDDILLYKLGYCEDGDYRGRIIFPSFDSDGALNFVVGRAFWPNIPSYKHGNYSKDIIFNDYLIDWDEPIVLTEGPFDAVKAGFNAIPLQGSNFSEGSKLFRKIVMTGVEVYFALDTDAFKKQLKMMEVFHHYGVPARYVNLSGKKDVGVMTKEEFQYAKSRAKPIRSDTDLLRLRVFA